MTTWMKWLLQMLYVSIPAAIKYLQVIHLHSSAVVVALFDRPDAIHPSIACAHLGDLSETVGSVVTLYRSRR